MIEIRWFTSGIFGFAAEPAPTREATVTAIAKASHIQAFTEYASGRLKPSLRDRLVASAFGAYGFSERSPKYVARQIKQGVGDRPYFSPRSRNYLKLANALLKRNPMAAVRALQDLSQGQAHMAEILHIPGRGFVVRSGGKRTIRTVLSLPGAKILNRGGQRTAVYRRELLDLDRGGGRDRRAIEARVLQLYAHFLKDAIESVEPRPLRAA